MVKKQSVSGDENCWKAVESPFMNYIIMDYIIKMWSFPTAGGFWWKVERFFERALWRPALPGNIFENGPLRCFMMQNIKFGISTSTKFQVALSLILSLLLFKPAPLYILDEVKFRIYGVCGKGTWESSIL